MSETKLKDNPSLRECQSYVKKVLDERGLGSHEVSQIFVKLIEEVGELAGAAKAYTGIKISNSFKSHEEVEGEAADVFIVFIDLCNKMDIDLEKAVQNKEAKNTKRKWQ